MFLQKPPILERTFGLPNVRLVLFRQCACGRDQYRLVGLLVLYHGRSLLSSDSRVLRYRFVLTSTTSSLIQGISIAFTVNAVSGIQRCHSNFENIRCHFILLATHFCYRYQTFFPSNSRILAVSNRIKLRVRSIDPIPE